MKKKKIETLQSMCDELFHHDIITGFQFTISYNHDLGFSCSLNKSESNVVIDCSESDVENKITNELFSFLPDHPQIMGFKQLQPEQIDLIVNMFKELNYEVEYADYCGRWVWLRVKCKNNEIPQHVEILKNRIKGELGELA